VCVCVCARTDLVIQHEMRMGMCHFVICGLPRSTIFFTFSHKQHDFRKKLLSKNLFFSSSITFV
jgi:hypothetical protein